MEKAAKTPQPGRDARGYFVKGNKIHRPKRKKRGLFAVASKEELNKVLRSLVDDALNGDEKARELVVTRMVPLPKPEHMPRQFDLDLTDLNTASASVLQAVARGELPSDVGRQLLDGLKSTATVGSLQTLTQQVATLTERLNNMENDRPQTLPAAEVVDPDDADEATVIEHGLDWLEHASD